MFGKLLSHRAGAAAVEYALLAGLVAVTLVGVLLSVGTGLNETMHKAERSTSRTIVVRS